MKKIKLSHLFCFLLLLNLLTGKSAAQDSSAVSSNVPKIAFENDLVRVVHARYQPGEGNKMHHHSKGVIVTITDLNVRDTRPSGRSIEVHLPAGSVRWREPVQHAVVNIGSKPIEAIELELKDTSKQQPFSLERDPLRVDSAHSILEIDNKYLRVVRFTLGPHEKSPMHDHPQCVAVNLTDAHVSITTPEGKTIVQTMNASQVQWQNPFSHAVENLSECSLEVIFIELKAPPSADDHQPIK